jgi:hypothetical protein
MTRSRGDAVSLILQKHCGNWSLVELQSGQKLRVFDIAWGRDLGNEFDHITTNISPGPSDDHTIDFFFTSEVVRVEDEATGRVLFEHETHLT